MRLDALFRLAFAPAPSFSDLTSPHARNSSAHSSKGTPSGYQPRSATPSDCLWARGFRFYFTPLIGVLFTFPSRYWFTIGQRIVFSLGRWSSQIPTGFLVPRGTRVPVQRGSCISSTGLSPTMARLSRRLDYAQ